MSKRQLNSAAPELLAAAKFAVRALRDNGEIAEVKDSVITRLQEAIDLAEPGEWQFRFTVTPRTWEHINKAVSAHKTDLDDLTTLRRLLKRGHRKTARRVYVVIDVDVAALSLFKSILAVYDPRGATSRAFDRLIAELDREIFNRPALEILAEVGL